MIRGCLPGLALASALALSGASAAGPEFVPAATCALCHSRIDKPGGAAGETAGQFPLWSTSMMANAARDPYWKAKMRHETSVTPAAAALVAEKCVRCHAPARGSEEGVTCTVCHQILPDGLGTRASFTGGFRFGAEARIFGPHADPFLMPMLHHTGYTATESKHVLDAALCGTCHTVITPTLDADGRAVGEFIEQAPYLEWLASDYPAAGVTCQSCHVPALETAQGELARQYIAHRPPGGPFPPTRPRAPFGLHLFAGANAAMLETLGVDAAHARASLARALDLDVGAARSGPEVEVTVDVRNLAGHKLPTAFPSRRLWLDVKILDAGGATLFESGAWDRASGELRAPAAQPHRAAIAAADEAMVYEVTYLDTAGRPTLSLLRAAGYGKDNRILPRGFDRTRALPGGLTARAVDAAGTQGDSGFRPGAHRVRYRYREHQGAAAAKVRVEAWYQSISPAHAAAVGGVAATARMPVLAAARETPVPGLP